MTADMRSAVPTGQAPQSGAPEGAYLPYAADPTPHPDATGTGGATPPESAQPAGDEVVPDTNGHHPVSYGATVWNPDALPPVRPAAPTPNGASNGHTPDGAAPDGPAAGAAPEAYAGNGHRPDGYAADGVAPEAYAGNGHGPDGYVPTPVGQDADGQAPLVADEPPTRDADEPDAPLEAAAAIAPASEAHAAALESDVVAPEADAVAPEADAVAPEADAFVPEAYAVSPEADAVVPEAYAVAPEADAVAPGVDAGDGPDAYRSEGPDGEPVADEGDPVPDEIVAAEVADRLGAVVGEDVEADPAEFAAAAVLDVLRASGWADAAEAAELRAEAERTRELLNMVVRDHRAREASAAGTVNQQLHWLVPLLRAAHGVAFGSLGAKVALRTAVQDVPPDVLAQAGLRIDYGVEHAPTDDDLR